MQQECEELKPLPVTQLKNYFAKQSQAIEDVKTVLKNTKDPVKSIEILQEENTVLKKKIELLVKEKAKTIKSQLKNEIQEINGVNYISTQIDLEAAALKDLAHELGNETNNLFFFAGTATNGKALLTCYISKNLVEEKELDAGKIVRELGKLIQGGGGGQKILCYRRRKKPSRYNCCN